MCSKRRATCSGPEYLEAHAKHEALTDPQVDAKAKKMLRGLGYRESDFGRKAKEMSGGWVMRAHLARLLVMEPDLLLLDEPTNHLDLLSLLWLQDYLKNYSGALLLISHDRAFMDEVVESVYEISEQKLIGYTGNYSEFLKQREANYEQQLAAYNNQQKEIARLREFYDRFRQVASKASQAMSKLKQIERMELVEKAAPAEEAVPLQHPAAAARRAARISLVGIHQAYGDHQVYRGLDLTIERGERTVLVGPNGAGKSTLLKILAGVIPFQKGEREPRATTRRSVTSRSTAPTRWTRTNRAAGGDGRRADAARKRSARNPRFVPVPQDEIYKKTGRAERRREEPAEPDQVPRRSRRTCSDGRADDAPRHPRRRVAHPRARRVRRARSSSSRTTCISSASSRRRCCT
jgi:ATP-binding cassette subfamily F protein 3